MVGGSRLVFLGARKTEAADCRARLPKGVFEDGEEEEIARAPFSRSTSVRSGRAIERQSGFNVGCRSLAGHETAFVCSLQSNGAHIPRTTVPFRERNFAATAFGLSENVLRGFARQRRLRAG